MQLVRTGHIGRAAQEVVDGSGIGGRIERKAQHVGMVGHQHRHLAVALQLSQKPVARQRQIGPPALFQPGERIVQAIATRPPPVTPPASARKMQNASMRRIMGASSDPQSTHGAGPKASGIPTSQRGAWKTARGFFARFQRID